PEPKKAWDLLLTRASLVALDRHLAPDSFPSNGRLDLQAAFDRDDPLAAEWLDDCVAALTHAISMALALLDVPRVIIDGDLNGVFSERLANALQVALAEAAPEARSTPELLFGSFGQDAGAIGAASLPMFFNFSPRASILTGGEPKRPAGAIPREDSVQGSGKSHQTERYAVTAPRP
ncbi:MAG: ROK family protein, partial [Roseibium sp.]